MCTWQAGLVGLGGWLNLSAERRQANAARVAEDRALMHQQQEYELNAAIKAKQAEQKAEAYAREQKLLNDRYKMTKGANAASAGASGISGATGSAFDLAEASEEQFKQASRDLLYNQRNDMFGLSMEEYNLRKSAENVQGARDYQKRAYRRTMKYGNIHSMLGLAKSVYNVNKQYKQMPTDSGDSGIYNPFASNMPAKGYNSRYSPNFGTQGLYIQPTTRLPAKGFNKTFGYPSVGGHAAFGMHGDQWLHGKLVR